MSIGTIIMTRLQSLLNLFNELPAATTIEKLRQIGYETTIHHQHCWWPTKYNNGKLLPRAYTDTPRPSYPFNSGLVSIYIWHSYLLSKSKQSSITTEYLIMWILWEVVRTSFGRKFVIIGVCEWVGRGGRTNVSWLEMVGWRGEGRNSAAFLNYKPWAITIPFACTGKIYRKTALLLLLFSWAFLHSHSMLRHAGSVCMGMCFEVHSGL